MFVIKRICCIRGTYQWTSYTRSIRHNLCNLNIMSVKSTEASYQSLPMFSSLSFRKFTLSFTTANATGDGGRCNIFKIVVFTRWIILYIIQSDIPYFEMFLILNTSVLFVPRSLICSQFVRICILNDCISFGIFEK